MLSLLTLISCDLLRPAPCADEAAAELYEHMSHTELEYDCRCGEFKMAEPLCNIDPLQAKEERGEGLGEGFVPDDQGPNVNLRYGDLWEDRGEIILAVRLYGKEPGLVMGLDYETGDRRVVSGVYTDKSGEQIVGDGPLFGDPNYAMRGPDDMLYVYAWTYDTQGEIFRVDPDSGDRELVWRHGEDSGFPQCWNGVPENDNPRWTDPAVWQLQLEGEGFAVSADGSFYLTTIRNGSPTPGAALLRIGKDGDSCEVVTMAPSEDGNTYGQGVGGGYDLGVEIREVAEIDGTLYISSGEKILQVDPATGDRTLLLQVNSGQMGWDYTRDMMFLSGIKNPYEPGLLHLDFDAEKAWWLTGCEQIEDGHPFAEDCVYDPGNGRSEEQAWVRPDGMIITARSTDSFSIIEPETGNAHLFSF